MSRIDIARLRKLRGIKAAELAKALFPDHKHPYHALNFVERGKAFLNSEQIGVLAKIMELPIGMVFEDTDWLMSSSKIGPSIIEFRVYDYLALYDSKRHTTKLSNANGVMYEEVVHDHGMGISEYEKFLTDLIIKHKQK
jgi:hypothetical protein